MPPVGIPGGGRPARPHQKTATHPTASGRPKHRQPHGATPPHAAKPHGPPFPRGVAPNPAPPFGQGDALPKKPQRCSGAYFGQKHKPPIGVTKGGTPLIFTYERSYERG